MQLGTSAQSPALRAVEVATPEPAAISVLNSDLLWYIFCINADLHDISTAAVGFPITRQDAFKRSALTVTRHTSQVCRSWRNLILHSPNIWGNLIDISNLYVGNDDWKDEVMKRTGEAVLNVHGSITTRTVMAFLVSLLNNHWWRVRILDIAIILGHSTSSSEGPAWDVLHTTALNLETFKVIFFGNDGDSPIKNLTFTSEAPMLRVFRCTSDFIGIDPNSPWLSHVRLITLPSNLNVPQLLQTLRHTKALETLIIGGANPSSAVSLTSTQPSNPTSSTTLLRPLSLPQLRAITLLAPHRAGVDFLRQITPSPDCALHWELVESIDNEELDATYGILSRYWLAFFSLRKVVKVDLHITASSFLFGGTCQLAPERYELLFLNRRRSGGLPPQFGSSLFKLVSSCNLSSVISLRMYGPFEGVIPKEDPAFLQFILSLSSLNVLLVDSCRVLDLLPQLPTDAWDVLPSLNTLKLKSNFLVKWEIDRLTAFLTWRKEKARLPIELLDATGLSKDDLVGGWGVLDKITGLKTVRFKGGPNGWGTYCGRGAPETP